MYVFIGIGTGIIMDVIKNEQIYTNIGYSSQGN